MGSNDVRHPWIPVTAEEATALRQQAGLVIGPGHPLNGLIIEADARCETCGAVAFRVEDGTFAIVVPRDGAEPEGTTTVRAQTRIDYEVALDAHHH